MEEEPDSFMATQLGVVSSPQVQVRARQEERLTKGPQD